MKIPSMEILTSKAYPELGAAVRAVLPHLMASWQKAVRSALPSANELTREQLRDDLPEILKYAANALESDQPEATRQLANIAPLHGEVRYDQEFKLDEVLIEYSILRSTLVLEVTAYLNRPLESAEFLALGAALDVTLREAVVRFVEHLTDQLKAVSESQSKYLSFLSHDLRGGLNGVFLMIELLKRELMGEPRLAGTVGDLDVMRRTLMETVATMDRFLHAERFRKGKVQVRPAEVSIRSFLAEMAAHFAYHAKDKDVELRVDVPQEFTLVSDKELLSLIFQNLLSNAVKYTRLGTKVTVAGRSEADACVFSVSDEGPGIAPEKLNDIFAPFARGETYGQPGVGLGLTIARQAAQYVGATLRAESEPGKGSTFFVEMPREMKK